MEKKLIGDTKLYIKPEGRIDVTTAVPFGYEVNDLLDDNDSVEELIVDFADITYVSSMGLRVLLEIQKRMNTIGKMQLMNVSNDVKDIFKMTGFDKILTII